MNLFVLQMAGTPGAGKSTLARHIAAVTGAVVLDYDVLKTAALDSGADWDLSGRVAYRGIHDLGGSILQAENSVILDSPCRFKFIVDRGQQLALEHEATYTYIECMLADREELRKRIEQRPRLRSMRLDFDRPSPDAPEDVMADTSGAIQLMQSYYPDTPYLQIAMSQPLERCLDEALAYLRRMCGAGQPQE